LQDIPYRFYAAPLSEQFFLFPVHYSLYVLSRRSHHIPMPWPDSIPAIPNLKIIATNMKKRLEKRVFYHKEPS
jgi:hypothetical protein